MEQRPGSSSPLLPLPPLLRGSSDSLGATTDSDSSADSLFAPHPPRGERGRGGRPGRRRTTSAAPLLIVPGSPLASAGSMPRTRPRTTMRRMPRAQSLPVAFSLSESPSPPLYDPDSDGMSSRVSSSSVGRHTPLSPLSRDDVSRSFETILFHEFLSSLHLSYRRPGGKEGKRRVPQEAHDGSCTYCLDVQVVRAFVSFGEGDGDGKCINCHRRLMGDMADHRMFMATHRHSNLRDPAVLRSAAGDHVLPEASPDPEDRPSAETPERVYEEGPSPFATGGRRSCSPAAPSGLAESFDTLQFVDYATHATYADPVESVWTTSGWEVSRLQARLLALLHTSGADVRDHSALFVTLDADGDGLLNLSQFLTGLSSLCGHLLQDRERDFLASLQHATRSSFRPEADTAQATFVVAEAEFNAMAHVASQIPLLDEAQRLHLCRCEPRDLAHATAAVLTLFEALDTTELRKSTLAAEVRTLGAFQGEEPDSFEDVAHAILTTAPGSMSVEVAIAMAPLFVSMFDFKDQASIVNRLSCRALPPISPQKGATI